MQEELSECDVNLVGVRIMFLSVKAEEIRMIRKNGERDERRVDGPRWRLTELNVSHM
jgi:hypothetical protein